MPSNRFEHLLELIEPMIKKSVQLETGQDTLKHTLKAIPAN